MKSFGIAAGIIILVIVAGLMTITIQKTNTDVTLQKTKVTMVMNGTKADRSWGQSHFEGLEKTAQELNLDVSYIENVNAQADTAALLKVFEHAIKSGAEIVIANSFGFGDAMLSVAAKHPEHYFFHASGVRKADNLSTYFGRIYQMRYLSGIVAGLQTQTNAIGYVAAFDISEVNRGINAFTLGVRSVNPQAKVYVKWSKSWVDETLAANATMALINDHKIDVLALHADVLSPFDVAEKNDVWIIGYNLDNAKRYPKRFLTAPVWKWEKFYTPRIREVLQHKFHADNYWLGVESGIVDLSPLTEHVTPKAKEIIEKETMRLRSGTFDVFYGPIRDNNGEIRIEAGESMSDATMLNSFDWYVDGVVIDE